jgi:hypothetical protein
VPNTLLHTFPVLKKTNKSVRFKCVNMYFFEDSLVAKECRQPYWAMVARDSRRFRRRIRQCEVLLKNVLQKKIEQIVNISV